MKLFHMPFLASILMMAGSSLAQRPLISDDPKVWNPQPKYVEFTARITRAPEVFKAPYARIFVYVNGIGIEKPAEVDTSHFPNLKVGDVVNICFSQSIRDCHTEDSGDGHLAVVYEFDSYLQVKSVPANPGTPLTHVESLPMGPEFMAHDITLGQ